MTLLEFNNEQPITYLWICGVACPGGQDFNHVDYSSDEYDPDTADDSDCDFRELDILGKLWHLEGEIDSDGRWCVNDSSLSDVRDERGNSIYNVKASR